MPTFLLGCCEDQATGLDVVEVDRVMLVKRKIKKRKPTVSQMVDVFNEKRSKENPRLLDALASKAIPWEILT